MKSINDIQKLLDDGEYSAAEETLWELKRKGANGAVPDYLLGCLYDDYKNPHRSKKRAQRHFTAAVQNTDPIEEAFIKLARLEQSRTHSERILKRGIKIFPRSVRLHERLLAWTDADVREELFLTMRHKQISSRDATATMIRTYLELSLCSKALELLADFSPRDDSQQMVLTLLRAMCLLELDDIENCTKLLESLVESDLSHSLGFTQYFGLIVCRLQQSGLKPALRVLNDIPGEADFQSPFDMEIGPLDQLYLRYANRAITALLKATKNRKVAAKVRGIRALIGGNEECRYLLPRAKILADLRFANKYLPENLNYCLRLAAMSIEDKDFERAHRLTVQYLHNGAWQEEEVLEEVDYTYIEQATNPVFSAIQKDILSRLQGGDCTDLEVLPRGPCVPIVSRLFENKNYASIVEIADAMFNTVLEASSVLFEIAYSYGECEKPEMARKFYEAYNANSPGSSAVENNLGVLYEGDGDYLKAREFYEKALSREKGSELYKCNLTRILDAERAAKRAVKSALSVKRTLVALWYEHDIDGYLPDPTALLARTLSLKIADARKAVQLLQAEGMIVPVTQRRHKYQCSVYRVNPYLLPSLPTIEAEVERTTDIVSSIEQITPESLASIGYDNHLTSSLKRVAAFDLQRQLQRDLREAAISLLTASYKTTLVLSGSIIEALILDRVSSRGITKYRMENGRNRATSKMDLGDLLFVAEKESIVDAQLYHLAQALRGFRNLIHPGVEKRKAAISVTEQNARIAWNITRKLICEI